MGGLVSSLCNWHLCTHTYTHILEIELEHCWTNNCAKLCFTIAQQLHSNSVSNSQCSQCLIIRSWVSFSFLIAMGIISINFFRSVFKLFLPNLFKLPFTSNPTMCRLFMEVDVCCYATTWIDRNPSDHKLKVFFAPILLSVQFWWPFKKSRFSPKIDIFHLFVECLHTKLVNVFSNSFIIYLLFVIYLYKLLFSCLK